MRDFLTNLLSRLRLITAAFLGGSFAAVVPANADPLTAAQILTEFNAVIPGTFSTTSDVEGRLVAGTIANTTSSTFYAMPNPLSSASTYQAVNALTIASCPSCDVNNGGSVNFINSNAGNFNFNAGGGHPKGSLVRNSPPFVMSAFTNPLNTLETNLSTLMPNSTFNGTAFIVTPVNGVAVFDISTTDLDSLSNIAFINLSPSDTIIVNVTGTSFAQIANFNAPDATFNSHTIWNFEGATDLSFKFWHGAVLAGSASVTNSSPIEGFLYAKNFTGDGELHDFPFTPTLVPEPSTWALSMIAFGALGFLGWRRSTRRP